MWQRLTREAAISSAFYFPDLIGGLKLGTELDRLSSPQAAFYGEVMDERSGRVSEMVPGACNRLLLRKQLPDSHWIDKARHPFRNRGRPVPEIAVMGEGLCVAHKTRLLWLRSMIETRRHA
jgi:hypothetical protein